MGEKPVARMASEGDAIWMLGGLYEVKVSSAETGGRLTVVQMTVPEGYGPPPHVHTACDETMYVLSGRVRVHMGAATTEAGPGAVFYFPRGTEEFFEPIGTASVLASYMPGGIDNFFAEAGQAAEHRELPPVGGPPPDFERLAAIAERYDLELKAPG
ncbi:cupin domain-containing protein [Longispora sp. K20-0274]|uniref:cupin domain-containing protein n=1 Tax=Longispora sp. K20-0274 TaxID=3088255 RepID=UPI00399BA9E4